MKPRRLTIVALLAALSSSAAFAQAPREKPDGAAAPQDPPAASSGRADAYYNYTMGHIYEQQYENSSKAEYATQAIEFYKKAYALDPKSAVIGERLAEMYWKAQRVHDAVSEAQEILKRDPNDVPTRRLLARIYVRSLGDSNASGGGSRQ
jgi:tetratricopeptide (TPR) repeat protein